MEKVRRCGSSHSQHESIFKQTAGTIKRVGVFHWINTRLVMEILLNLISSPLKLITISYMRYSLPRIVSLYHLLTACLLIVYWVLSREKEHDTAGIMLQLSVCSKSVANAESAPQIVYFLGRRGGIPPSRFWKSASSFQSRTDLAGFCYISIWWKNKNFCPTDKWISP